MSAGWGKLHEEIVRSSIWSEDYATRLVWVTMIAIKDATGYVGASVTGLARTANVTVPECQAALEKLLAPDPDSRSKEFDGRRIEVADRGWRVLNSDRFRNGHSDDPQAADARERKRRSRERQAARAPLSALSPQRSDPDPKSDADADTVSRDVTGQSVTSRDICDGHRAAAAAAAEPAASETRIRIAEPIPSSPRQPGNLAEALEVPIGERAGLITGNPHLSQWLQPEKWPEVVAVATELHRSAQLGPVRLGAYNRDSGVRAVVGLFADGFTTTDLAQVAKTIPRSSWWRGQGKSRGLSSLTPEAVRREQVPPGAVLHEQTRKEGEGSFDAMATARRLAEQLSQKRAGGQ